MKTRLPRLVWLVLFTSVLGGSTAVYAADAAKGKSIYEGRCAFCHGMGGKGDGIAGASLKPPPSNFTSVDYWKTTTPERMRDAIENGKPNTAMVGLKATLKPGDTDDLVAYLETFRPK